MSSWTIAELLASQKGLCYKGQVRLGTVVLVVVVIVVVVVGVVVVIVVVYFFVPLGK
jgi:hypothetical protein